MPEPDAQTAIRQPNDLDQTPEDKAWAYIEANGYRATPELLFALKAHYSDPDKRMTLTLEHKGKTYKITIDNTEPTLENLQSACILINEWVKESNGNKL